MKTLNHILTVKTIAVCALGISLFAASFNTFADTVEVLKFDELANYSAVPDGYGFVGWTNFYALDAVGTNSGVNPSGYETDVISPNNVLYNNNGTPAAIYANGHPFVLYSANLESAWNDNLQVQVNGYSGNKLVYSKTYTLSATQPTYVTFPKAMLTEVDFISSGGTPHAGYAGNGEHFAVDNAMIVVFSQSAPSSPLHLPAAG